jgi:thiamine-monophosphate kinase
VTSGEDKLIGRFFKPLATHPGALALADDAAILESPAGHDLVLTADALTGGVHFFPDDPPDLIARKALRVNLSDLAAKGAKPIGFLLTLALPSSIEDAWLEKFSAGLRVDAGAFGCPLFGGDTIRTSGPVTISIFAFGSAPRGKMVRRDGAKMGDRIIVTGTIGDAALGLAIRNAPDIAQGWKLDATMNDHLAGRYLLPQPRIGLAEALQAYASAAMDVSDGLVGDLTKLCGVSGVSAEIDVSAVPLSEAAKRAQTSDGKLIETILTGGDDYEVVCAVKPEDVPNFRTRAAKAGIAITDVGAVIDGKDAPRFIGAGGTVLSFSRKSFSHF